jgi:2,5-diketo-D-gluconate reductase A
VGEAIRRSGLDRSEIFLETKAGITDHGHDETLHAFDESAGKLGMDQIDLLILHQPLPGEFDLTLDAYRALEKLLADGKDRAIGVSNFMPDHLSRLLAETSVVPAVNQIEVTRTSASPSAGVSTPSTASSRRRGRRSAASPATETARPAAPRGPDHR